VTAGCGRERTA